VRTRAPHFAGLVGAFHGARALNSKRKMAGQSRLARPECQYSGLSAALPGSIDFPPFFHMADPATGSASFSFRGRPEGRGGFTVVALSACAGAELPEQQFNTWIRPLQAVEPRVLRLLAPSRRGRLDPLFSPGSRLLCSARGARRRAWR
jgi:hypothetical protein